ncbi:MAG TPA: TIGR04282 family arsenosugar biosynthesis glycosyltransferase [Halioglobus sp.]
MDADSLNAKTRTRLLIQFARAPQVGHVKTRMLTHLSASRACDVHCELTLWTCRQLLDSKLGNVELSVTGDTQHALFRQCRAMGVKGVEQQRGADLGERMYNALQRGLTQYASVILVSSDCPGIDPAYLRQAVVALQSAPIVLGPATDSGYVLIGAARAITSDIFADIPWGSDKVYETTVTALSQAGLEWAELPGLTDIDRPEDLAVWEAVKRQVSHNTG